MSFLLAGRRKACAARRVTILVAQASSSAGGGRTAGEDAFPARRRRHPGDVLRSEDRQILEVRQRGDAVGDADLRIRERVIDRRDQIVDRSLEALDEGRGDPLRSGGDVDRRRLQEQAGGDLRHVRIDVEQRLALAVDRHVDLLAGSRAAEQEAVGVAVQLDAQDVVAVGGEGVGDRNAAARAERRAVDAAQLRRGLGDAVMRFGRLRVGIADREHGHLAGGAQVAVHQRRRQRLRVGDVVEAGADRVGRQQTVDVDVEREQILHRARVLDAIQSLKRTPSGIGHRCRGLVDTRLERRGERDQGVGVGTARAGRRHHPRAQLADHLLGDVAVLRRGGGVEGRQRQAARLAALAVTPRAVLAHQRGLWIGGRCLRGRAAAAGEHHGDENDSRFHRKTSIRAIEKCFLHNLGSETNFHIL